MTTVLRRCLRSEDHYYWLTAYLAARGLQRATCRVLAFNLIGLSAIPLILLLSESGPAGATNRWLALGVSVCCILMGSLWLRSRWPSRLQSQACVVLGSLCITVGCLIVSAPALGLMGAATFVVVSAFTALFHDGRLLTVTWLIGAATLVALAVRLGTAEPAVTISAAALFVLINVFVVFVCRNLIRLVRPDVHYGELDPLTGLLTRDAFADRVATMVAARDRNDDRYIAIIVVSLDSFSLLRAMNGDSGGDDARVAIGHRIRETLRRDALLAHVGDSEYLVADTFTSADATVLSDRLHHTVRSAPYRLSASIGVVATPLGPLVGRPPHDVVEELITIATSTMFVARKGGGHRTETTVNPALTSLQDSDATDWDNDDLTA